MSTNETKTCAHCAKPLKATGKGRPAKVHPECRSAYRAAQKRAQRLDEIAAEAEDRGMTAEQVRAERKQRSRDAFDMIRHRPRMLRDLKYGTSRLYGGIMGESEGAYVRGGTTPLVGRTVVRRKPMFATHDPATGKFGKVADVQRPIFAGPRVWKREIRKATARLLTQGVQATSADVARHVFLPHYADLQLALDAVRDLDAEGWLVTLQRDRAQAVEEQFAEAVEAVGRAGIEIFRQTGDPAVLEALTGIPGFRGLQDFRADTLEGAAPTKTLTVSEQFALEISQRIK